MNIILLIIVIGTNCSVCLTFQFNECIEREGGLVTHCYFVHVYNGMRNHFRFCFKPRLPTFHNVSITDSKIIDFPIITFDTKAFIVDTWNELSFIIQYLNKAVQYSFMQDKIHLRYPIAASTNQNASDISNIIITIHGEWEGSRLDPRACVHLLSGDKGLERPTTTTPPTTTTTTQGISVADCEDTLNIIGWPFIILIVGCSVAVVIAGISIIVSVFLLRKAKRIKEDAVKRGSEDEDILSGILQMRASGNFERPVSEESKNNLMKKQRSVSGEYRHYDDETTDVQMNDVDASEGRDPGVKPPFYRRMSGVLFGIIA